MTPLAETPPRTLPTLHPLVGAGLAALCGALLVVLLYQFPVTHTVDVGGYDAAYVQGFHAAQAITATGGTRSYLAGTDGTARWSRAQSDLLLPQAGRPASLTVRVRGWRPPGEPPPTVTVLVNGMPALTDVPLTGEWQDLTVPLTGGWLKLTDEAVTLVAPTAPLPDEGRDVGILLDRATYRVGGGVVTPAPVQVLLGAVAGGLLWLLLASVGTLTPRRRLLLAGAAASVLALAFALLYRAQLPYPYPVRGLLPAVVLLLVAALAVRWLPVVVQRVAWLPDAAAGGVVVLWGMGLWGSMQQHVTLAVPGVEKDFRVFATRTSDLNDIFKADGFYNLGYPLLLWLVQPFTAGNPFLAARLVALLAGAVLLLAGWWLARCALTDQPVWQRLGALLAVLLLACSPLVVQYALLVGSDMPFAACVTLALALVATAVTRSRPHTLPHVTLLLLAGIAGGLSFLMRHAGMAVLVWGVLALLVWRDWRGAAGFAAGFVLAASPQLWVNLRDTGDLLYNQQPKNVWLAVYAGVDWGRWGDVPDSIALGEVLLRDPPRFAANWGHNLLAYLGGTTTTARDDARAVQLHLLAFPANWLAVAGLVGWLVQAAAQWRQQRTLTPAVRLRVALLAFGAGFVLLTAMAFLLLRFVLPLAPLYGLAAAWLVGWLLATLAPTRDSPTHNVQRATVVTLLLLAMTVGSVGAAQQAVLAQQPPDEVAAITQTLARLQPGERVLVQVPTSVPIGKYSALAHHALPWTDGDPAATIDAAQQQGAAWLLWDSTQGIPPVVGAPAAHAGRYTLYPLAPIVGAPAD